MNLELFAAQTEFKAPAGVIILDRPKGASPTAQRTDTPESAAWVEKIHTEATALLESKKAGYWAPEHPARAFYETIALFGEKLKIAGTKVSIWEVNRELVKQNQFLNGTGFSEACRTLFE